MFKEFTIKMLGSHKIKLSSGMLKLAACFVDYEAEYLPPDSRIVEYGFTFSRIMNKPIGKILDVGYVARHNYVIPSLSFKGWEVVGIDIRSEWTFHHPNFKALRGDMRKSGLPDNYFDIVTCISTMEHIGLVGYYGVTQLDTNGDYETIKEMSRVLKRGGELIVTVPYSKEYSLIPGARVYSLPKLKTLFSDFEILDKVIYLQDKKGEWNFAGEDITDEGVICLQLKKN